MQVGDEGTHEARLAHAGGEGKADGGKLSLEVGDCWELATQRG